MRARPPLPPLAMLTLWTVGRPHRRRHPCAGPRQEPRQGVARGREPVDRTRASRSPSGLRLEMEGGWHTYWKNPGDAGLPPKVNWRLPEGFVAGPIQWPVPLRIDAPAIDELRLRGRGAAADRAARPPPAWSPATEVVLAGRADWVECKDVCIPGRAEVELRLPVKAEPVPELAASSPFVEARRRQPSAPEGWALEASAAAGKILLSFVPPKGGVGQRGLFLRCRFVDGRSSRSAGVLSRRSAAPSRRGARGQPQRAPGSAHRRPLGTGRCGAGRRSRDASSPRCRLRRLVRPRPRACPRRLPWPSSAA